MKSYINSDVALLLLRLALGAVFVAHGWQKLGNMDGTISFFASIGFPAFLAYLVALVEFLGGIAVLLGVYLTYAGTLLAIVMLVAIVVVKSSKGFVGGFEFDVVLLALALAIPALGAGKYAVKMGK